MRCRPRGFGAFDDEGGGDVAEDEMAVAVAEIEMARTDLRIAHQDRARVAGSDHVGGGLQAEGRRRAGDVHVEAETLDAERVLHFDRHGGIGALHVGGGDDYGVDIGGGAVGRFERIAAPPSRPFRPAPKFDRSAVRECGGT